MSIKFLDTIFPNPLVLASSPLTEQAGRIRRGELYGAGGAILKTCCAYERKENYDTRKVIFSPDRSRYYACSSFEREILTAGEGLALYQEAVSLCSIPIIPSVTALSLDPADWLPLCRRFQEVGAALIQLDFFYLGNLLGRQNFSEQLSSLLKTLLRSLDCGIMPKVNVDLPADYIFGLMADAGVKAVSLLDSVRVPVTESVGGGALPFSSTSCFGAWQLPLSLHYAYAAKQHRLEICGGGGITDPASIAQMQSCGAGLVQVASAVLLHGYGRLRELSQAEKPAEQEAAGQEAAGQEPAGQEPAGQEPAGQEAAGQEPAGQEPAGQEPARQEPAGQKPAGQEPAGQEPAGQEAAGQECETSLCRPRARGYQVRRDKCTRCHSCTESSAWCDAITTDEDGTAFIREEFCEACGWCAGRCPAGAIV